MTEQEDDAPVEQDIEQEEATQSNAIEQWQYVPDDGVWQYDNGTIKIRVSFWQHHNFKDCHIALTRWTYLGDNFASYLKMKNAEGCTEDMLFEAAKFVTQWYEEQSEDSIADDFDDEE